MNRGSSAIQKLTAIQETRARETLAGGGGGGWVWGGGVGGGSKMGHAASVRGVCQ